MTHNAQAEPVVEFRALGRRFGRTTALQDVSLSLSSGTVIGLIGRNGSGKTTLLQHVMGLLLPDAGECLTFGTPAARLDAGQLARIGAVWQQARLIEWMPVQRLIDYVAAFHAVWDRELEHSLLSRLDIDTSARVGTLSPGGRQRLQLLLALCHHPELLLLDEPLSDLDPTARAAVLDVLLDVFERDRPTIVISSHLLHDIEPVITHVVCLANGRVSAHEELDALKERHGVNLEGLFPLLTA